MQFFQDHLGLPKGRGRWLALALPLVFGIGAPTILLSRALCVASNPELFANDSPTISETAAHAPASLLFALGMSAVVACIFISWTLTPLYNARHIRRLPSRRGWFTALSLAGAAVGMIAGACLELLSLYGLHTGHDMHMMSSWGFYIAQVVAILLDIALVLALRRASAGRFDARGLAGRMAVAGLVLLGSIVFLYLYENKDFAPATLRYPVQLVYVTAENILCLLFLFYPSTMWHGFRRAAPQPLMAETPSIAA